MTTLPPADQRREARSRRHIRSAAITAVLSVIVFAVSVGERHIFANPLHRDRAVVVLVTLTVLLVVILIFVVSQLRRIVSDIAHARIRLELASQTAGVALIVAVMARLVVLTHGFFSFLVRRPERLDPSILRVAQDTSTTFLVIALAGTAVYLLVLGRSSNRSQFLKEHGLGARVVIATGVVVTGLAFTAGGSTRAAINQAFVRVQASAGAVVGGTGWATLIAICLGSAFVFGLMITNLDQEQLAEDFKAKHAGEELAKMLRGELLFPDETELYTWGHDTQSFILTDRRCIYRHPEADQYGTAEFGPGNYQVIVFNRHQEFQGVGGSSGFSWANPNVPAGDLVFGGGSSAGVWRGDSQIVGTVRIVNSQGHFIDWITNDPDGMKAMIDHAMQIAIRRFQAKLQPILERARHTERLARDTAQCSSNPAGRHLHLGSGTRESDLPKIAGYVIPDHSMMSLPGGGTVEEPMTVHCSYCGLDLSSQIEVLREQVRLGLADYRRVP